MNGTFTRSRGEVELHRAEPQDDPSTTDSLYSKTIIASALDATIQLLEDIEHSRTASFLIVIPRPASRP